MKKILLISVIPLLVDMQPASPQTFTKFGVGITNTVYAIAVDGSGSMYVGGDINYAGGNVAHEVAKWNGSSWSNMDMGMSDDVKALTVFNNEVYAGGRFVYSGSGSTVTWMVTKWNGSSWVALGNGLHGISVNSLCAYQSQLYAGGFFDTVYTPGNAIAKWNGSTWVALGSGANKGVFGSPGYNVKVMKVFGSNLYVGGTFTTAGGIPASNIAKWDGTSWSAVGSGTNGDVNAMEVYNGNLYIGGNFTVAGGVTVNYIAKISGTIYSPVGPGPGTNGVINALASYNNNLYATGNFTVSGGVSTQNISRWDGTSWHQLVSSIPGISGPGYALYPSNGNLLIGGLFTEAGSVLNAGSIVAWNLPTGIEEANSSNYFKIYPNPSQGKFTLQLTQNVPENFEMQLRDISGRLIFSREIKSNVSISQTEIEIPAINKGMYFLKLVNDKTSACEKLMIE